MHTESKARFFVILRRVSNLLPVINTIQTNFPNIEVILGERLDLSTVDKEERDEKGQRVVKTVTGREIHADYLV
jgi:hypothetical protein